tara:strand:- start:479 stop:817 length:339 start_codon:yes stop_codon:yes gene_type:complete
MIISSLKNWIPKVRTAFGSHSHCHFNMYKINDIVLVKSSAAPAMPPFKVKLLERIKRDTSFDPIYIIWRTKLTSRREADRMRKEWGIPFKFPNEVETFVYETNIIKLIKTDG